MFQRGDEYLSVDRDLRPKRRIQGRAAGFLDVLDKVTVADIAANPRGLMKALDRNWDSRCAVNPSPAV